MFVWPRLTLIALTAGLIGSSIPAQDRTAELRARFVRESDPIHKAKLLPALSDSEFGEMRALVADENLTEASHLATELAEEAETAVKALDAKGRDPEKHPDGYKQVEFSVRSSLRRIDYVLAGLSADNQLLFLAVRGRLNDLERQLIHDLFPRRPDSSPVQPAPEPKT